MNEAGDFQIDKELPVHIVNISHKATYDLPDKEQPDTRRTRH